MTLICHRQIGVGCRQGNAHAMCRGAGVPTGGEQSGRKREAFAARFGAEPGLNSWLEHFYVGGRLVLGYIDFDLSRHKLLGHGGFADDAYPLEP